MRVFTLLCLPLCSILWCAMARADEEPATQEVFRKALPDGAEIVVTRKAMGESRELATLLSARLRNVKDKKVHTISVAARSRDGQSTQIASCIQIETIEPNTGFAVLDVVIGDGELLLVIGVGTRLGLWRIRLEPFSEDAVAWLDGWQLDPCSMAVTPARVNVKLARLADGRWQASVVEVWTDPNPPTVYEQAPEAWEMVVVQGSNKATK